MKRLLKAFVILAMLIAGILLVIRWLERKGEDGSAPEPAWPPPPSPTQEPSGIAEEMVSVVDEPIAVEPEPASEASDATADAEAEAQVERGEALTEELLGS